MHEKNEEKDENTKKSFSVRTVKLSDPNSKEKSDEVAKLQEKEERIKTKLDKTQDEKEINELNEKLRNLEQDILKITSDPDYYGRENVRVKYIENDRNPNQVREYDASELLRIVAALEGYTGEQSDKLDNKPDLWGVLFVELNKSTNKYKKIMQKDGVLELVHCQYKNTEIKRTGETESFKRLMCGSSHSRQGKVVFIREDLYDAVHTILLGGMGKPKEEIEFKKGCAKWNAYYALAATDSTPVTTPDKIIVIKDFERKITTKCDVVTMEKEKDQVKYSLYADRDYEIDANVFDGAGLVSVTMAKQWEDDLKLDHIPSSFQIRAIPGIKGNVYTFDIAKFAEEKNDGKYEIIDINGKTVTFNKNDKIVILTESQVKFLSMYKDIDDWRKIFDTPVEVEVNGKTVKYKRTFNISEYSEKQKEVKKRRYTAYQHLQTVKITGDDAENLVKDTMSKISEISKDILKFLKYRQALDETSGDATGGDDEKNKEILPPYYKAAAEYVRQLENQGKDEKEIEKLLEKCFADSYFVKKMEDDIKARKDGAYAGKLTVTGNYQVFTPDLFALCEHAFGKEPNGLLRGDEIYSAWWLKREENDKERFKCDELAITRNPQIYMESRIVKPARREELDDWFSYQKTGILISSHSHVPYALGTADFDGDTVATTNNAVFINAVKAEIESGNGNTIYLEKDAEKISELKKSEPDKESRPDCEVSANCGKNGKAPSSKNMNDIQALMAADLIAFDNNIGTVVNLITRIWNFDQNSEGYSYYWSESKSKDGIITKSYMRRSVSEEETNDAAKTGDEVVIPESENETEAFLAQRRNYLKIMSVIGQLTLDAAKTGDEVVIPDSIKNFIKNNSVEGFKDKMPNFIDHTKKRLKEAKDKQFLFNTLTMETIGGRVSNFLSQERSEMRRDILDSYQDTGYFPFSLDEKGEELRKCYEELRGSGDQDKEEKALNKLVDAALVKTTWHRDFEEFKKIAHVNDVDLKLYEAVKEALKKADHKHSLWSDYLKYLKPAEKQKQYRRFYSMVKRRLLSLNAEDNDKKILRDRFSEDDIKKITVGELLDCYIVAAEEIIAEKETKEIMMPKNILWNCFGEEITERIKNGRTEEDEKPVDFELSGDPLEKGETRGKGTTLFNELDVDVTFFESDIKFIKKKVGEAYKGDKPAMQKRRGRILLLCSAFAVITKARAGKKENGFTVAEITKNSAGFVRDCMCVPPNEPNEVETVRKNIISKKKIDKYLETLTKNRLLKEDKGRYSVVFPKSDGKEVFTANTSKKAEFEAYKKAAEAILSEIP